MKWGIDYVTCNPSLARGHKYIIVAIDYFMKLWKLNRVIDYFYSQQLTIDHAKSLTKETEKWS